MTSVSGSFFVDANVLVYAVQDDPRYGVATALLEDATQRDDLHFGSDRNGILFDDHEPQAGYGSVHAIGSG